MKTRLTETSVLKLKLQPGETDEFFFDEKIPGFGVRIRDGGSRKYLFQYRYAGKSRRLIFGDVSSLDFAEAQKRARRARVALDEGRDPAFEKAANKAAGKVTFGSVALDYMQALEKRIEEGNLKPRSEVEIRRHVMERFKPLHGMPITAITRGDVAARLRELAKSSGTGAADRTQSNVSTFFAWAIGEGICETNPVLGTNKHAEPVERERSLISVVDEKPTMTRSSPSGRAHRTTNTARSSGC
jgi:Arm domain-containing DNA-binding protein/integrase-like protein